MAFNHQNYNTQYLLNAKESDEPINDAQQYGVRIVETDAAEGEVYWKVIGIHHLLPRENFSNHHVYLEALDEEGRRIRNPFAWAGWTWEGRQPHERADPVVLDKPDYEPAANIAMHFAQTISVWIRGLSRDANAKSDRVENLHTRHPDEPLPDGSLLNTVGHHSFYVVFQRTRKSSAPAADGVITGRVERGQGRTLQLLKSNVVVAEQTIGSDLNFRFENLSYGTYQLKVVGTNVSQANIRIAGDNKTANIVLALPPPAQSTISGRVQNGFGKTLLLIKEGSIIARLTLPQSETFKFINLAQGVYSLQVFDTNIRQDNIVLDGTNSREITLVVPTNGDEPPEKTINHYLLIGPPGSRGRQTNLLLATDFVLAFSVTVGFSVAEAKQARQVTILGEGISAAEQEAISSTGSQVELLPGNPYDIEAELARRVQTGQAFPARQDVG